MKSKKKSFGYEPNLSDVLEAVQTGFTKVDGRLDRVEGRLGEVEYRMTALEKRTGSLEDTVEEMNETLQGVARAVDKDAVAILDHERRIRHLEKAAA
jgi:hypothetical protein